ncbi:hypothetical protein BJ322DRAFT_1070641 [Thelephora terrestris]|uniref:Uncharacterized protein n=1 Tax=Thelephora terrestris TaxID=56493 RepID=A0A9P6L5E2_9AGAM|nr:hypothetical protein BJ322DRAFT_1070641 [Thelephora terrestris]
MSNLFLDLTRVVPNPILASYPTYLGVAASGYQAAIANTLIVWYMLLGGCVEEETFWAIDKSDSLKPILSLLAPRVENAIPDERGLEYLDSLLEFLAAWDKRPVFLTRRVYKWCSALFEVVDRIAEDPRTWMYGNYREVGRHFRGVGPYYDGFRSGDAPDCSSGYSPVRGYFIVRLFRILAIGFRQVDPHGWPALRLDHASQSNRMFETIFSSYDDETIADAVCIWVVDGAGTPPGSLARYLARRVERDEPLSPRLRRVAIHAIGRIGQSELKVSGLETIRLLNRLKVDVEEISDNAKWTKILISAIHSPAVRVKSLSSHCFCLLGKLVELLPMFHSTTPLDVEVMRSLVEAGDWERLEAWIVVIWWGNQAIHAQWWGGCVRFFQRNLASELIEDIGWATLRLLLHQPSALPRFEGLCDKCEPENSARLQSICARARAGPLPSKCPPQSQLIHASPVVPLDFGGDDTF